MSPLDTPDSTCDRYTQGYIWGEDFDHLLTGLRQIDEPFEWGVIANGDRLGHALALGLSPKEWCKEHPWIQMRPWDRLLDVGYVYSEFERARIACPADVLERLRASAGEAIFKVFLRSDLPSLETARDVWRTLPRMPSILGGSSTSAQLISSVLDSAEIGKRALSPSLTLETQLDEPLLNAVHDAVLDRVAKSHAVVEVNPSSNLLVGGFRSIFHQPTFHTDEPPITLIADDPLTFATTLADEYAYAWAGMVLGSVQPPH